MREQKELIDSERGFQLSNLWRNEFLPEVFFNQNLATDDHACGQKGWCKDSCLPTETKDWTLKDLCGILNCCAPLESNDYEHSEDPSTTESIQPQS